MKENCRRKIYIKAISILLVGILGYMWLQSVPYVIDQLFRQKENNVYIQYDQLTNMLNNRDEAFFLIISKEGCPQCEDLEDQLVNNPNMFENDVFNIFKYKKEDSQVIVSELENIFPNFFTVPYICYVNSNSIERYDGELDISIIVGWMEEIK